MCLAAYWNCLVGQVGLEPTTSSGNGFTVRGDTNYALLTHMVETSEVESAFLGGTTSKLFPNLSPYLCAVSDTSRNPVFYMLSALGLASMVLKVNKSLCQFI